MVTKVDKLQIGIPQKQGSNQNAGRQVKPTLEIDTGNGESQDGDENNGNYENGNDGPQSSDQPALSTIEDFQSSELHRNHLIQTLQSLQYIKTLPPVNKNDIKTRTVKLPTFRGSHIKKTIIFDLDETLVHCIDDIDSNPCD